GVLDQLPGIDAGILHDDVEAPETCQGESHRGLGIGRPGDIGMDESGTQFVRCGPSCVLLPIGQHQARAFLCETDGGALADATGGADDEGDLSRQTPAHASCFRMVCLSVSSNTAASTRRPWMTWV